MDFLDPKSQVSAAALCLALRCPVQPRYTALHRGRHVVACRLVAVVHCGERSRHTVRAELHMGVGFVWLCVNVSGEIQ
jgi:hypothetical protein